MELCGGCFDRVQAIVCPAALTFWVYTTAPQPCLAAHMKFDATTGKSRLQAFWSLKAEFGAERDAYDVYLEDIVSDRYSLVKGLQLVRDELQLAGLDRNSDISACGADFSLPSVVTTLAHTNCGDRIHQGEATSAYMQTVASRFATISEMGEFKLEAFAPTGGGTDDGATFAHVTWAHHIDDVLREQIYRGNAASYILCNFDLKTHVGRMDDNTIAIGKTQESKWRYPRAACGAIVGCLAHYNEKNGVHRRLRADLTEAGFAHLREHPVKTADGIDVTPAVAAAIVSVRGMLNTAQALAHEMDERGLAHLTATMTVNRPGRLDTIVYLGRATVFDGEIITQGLGTDAAKYSAAFTGKGEDAALVLSYDGHTQSAYPVDKTTYEVRQWEKAPVVPLLED